MVCGRRARTTLLAIAMLRGNFVAAGACSGFINMLMLVAPLYMLQVYDRVLGSRSTSTLIALTAIACALLVVMGLLDLVRSRFSKEVEEDVNKFLTTHDVNVVHMAQSEHGEYLSVTLIYEVLRPIP